MTVFTLFFCLQLSAHTLKGTVYATDNKKPVALASVFLSNTSLGTITDAQGSFLIDNLAGGKYELVVSFVGYETVTRIIEAEKQTAPIEILLKPKVKELDNVVVEPFEKEDWAKWGSFFTRQFIGYSEHAQKCVITNPKVIQFRNYTKSKRLVAIADEPIIIENKALGYRIKYHLDKFEYNAQTRLAYYQGFPLFEELETGSASTRKRWESNRMSCYKGSLMHFMRSLYRNQLEQNDFEIRRLQRIPNYEKLRVKKLLASLSTDALAKLPIDSSDYYNEVSGELNIKELLGKDILPTDSVAFVIDSLTAGMFFKNHLHVVYYGQKEPYEYVQAQRRNKAREFQISILELPNKKALAVTSNGSFFRSYDVLLEGYWAFWEKMGTMLPLDYQPSLPLNKKTSSEETPVK